MGWFITSSWDRLSGIALFGIAITYAALFGGLGVRLFRQLATRIPGGILVAVAVCMTPLAVYGIERQMGWWSCGEPTAPTPAFILVSRQLGADGDRRPSSLPHSPSARIRFPFLTAPAARTRIRYLVDGAIRPRFSWGALDQSHRRVLAIWVPVGLVMLLVAIPSGRRIRTGLFVSFCLFSSTTGGLTLLGDGSQLGKAIYCRLHLLLMLLAVLLQRKVFLIFGAFGAIRVPAGRGRGLLRNSAWVHRVAYRDRCAVWGPPPAPSTSETRHFELREGCVR